MRAARKYPPPPPTSGGGGCPLSSGLVVRRRRPFSCRLLVSWCAVALPLSLLSYPLRPFARLPWLVLVPVFIFVVLVVMVLAVWFSLSSCLSSPSLSSSCPRVFVVVVGGWWTALRRHSTHDPPHEQLLVRLGVGGVRRPRRLALVPSSPLSSVAPVVHPASSCSRRWGRVLGHPSSFIAAVLASFLSLSLSYSSSSSPSLFCPSHCCCPPPAVVVSVTVVGVGATPFHPQPTP
jgi:hypothetical protein